MKRTTMIGAGLAALLATTAGVALAQGAQDGMMQGMRGDGPMAMFEEFDADGNGSVTAAEIEAHRAARFAELDADGNGQVSRQEFMDHAAARAGERAGTMFDRLDADGDGTLSRDAIEARGGPGPDAARMIERFDADGDGAISETELAEVRDRFMERREGRGGDRMGRWAGREGHGMGRHDGHGMGGHGRWHDDG
jgi:Ca2+-binding EF-hand superfamily protein